MTDPAPSTEQAAAAARRRSRKARDGPRDRVALEYLAAVEAIAGGHGPVAVDAERASGYRYSQRAYLIQVFRRGAGSFLFDPIAIGSFAELQDAIVDEEWLFHAASQDLPCLQEVGLVPTRIFDTELGARIAGFPRVGLGAVVEQLLGITLAKAHSAADWSTRPLPQSWLVYAALDVELLPDLRDALAAVLEEAGKTRIAEEEFAAVLTRAPKPPGPSRGDGCPACTPSAGPVRSRSPARCGRPGTSTRAQPTSPPVAPSRTPRSSQQPPRTPRRRANSPASRRSPDGRAAVRWTAGGRPSRPGTTEDLPRLRAVGDPSLPPPRAWADRNPEADRRYKAARAAVVARAEALDLPVENLLTPDTLRTVSWEPPTRSPPRPSVPPSPRTTPGRGRSRRPRRSSRTPLSRPHRSLLRRATPARRNTPTGMRPPRLRA